jgi:membrane protein DedA with SNARE-associated domain
MPWRQFLLYNAMDAMCWVSTIACIGYAFGGTLNSLTSYFEKASWTIAAGVFAVGYLLRRRGKRRFRLSPDG